MLHLSGQAVAPFRSNTASGTFTPDAAGFNTFLLTLTGNLTIANPSGLRDGQVLNFVLRQDATGSRTLTLGSKFKITGGQPTASTAASAIDALSVVYDATADQLIGSYAKAAA